MISLSLACGRYDRTEALRDGRVRVEGVDLAYLPLEAEEAFWRMLRNLEFDASEMSLGAYVSRRDRGVYDLVAIPVFPSRMFRHAAIYVPADSAVAEPGELRGSRIGVPEYRMTAAIWVKGFLESDFGVAPSEVTWVEGGLEEPGRASREPRPPIGVRVVDAPAGQTLSQLLADRQLDALITARAPSTLKEGRVRRLFSNPWDEERRYFERERIFPIMHTVVIRADVLDRFPWVGGSLVKAFEQAKRCLLVELEEESALRSSLPFQIAAWRETQQLMGRDPWPYGIEENERTLDKFLDYATSQGILSRKPELQELFAPSTLSSFKI